jgi:hypothetical protein
MYDDFCEGEVEGYELLLPEEVSAVLEGL